MEPTRSGVASRLGVAFSPMVRQFNAGLSAVDAVGPYPPAHILTDEKFARLNGEQIYLFLLSQEELIWYTEWMERTDEASFNTVIVNALGGIEASGQTENLWAPDVFYTPTSVTTDGWKPVQTAWQTLVPGIDLIECNLHDEARQCSPRRAFQRPS